MYTNPESSTEERISIALKKSGVSITITSVTDFIAFMVGLFASFKSVQIFSVYAGTFVAIIFYNKHSYHFSLSCCDFILLLLPIDILLWHVGNPFKSN